VLNTGTLFVYWAILLRMNIHADAYASTAPEGVDVIKGWLAGRVG
jgi:hypothetical protein